MVRALTSALLASVVFANTCLAQTTIAAELESHIALFAIRGALALKASD